MSILQKPHVQLMLYRRLAVLAAAAPAAWPCGCMLRVGRPCSDSRHLHMEVKN